MKYTPMIADSETVETLKLAEEISTFFEDQKLKAQDRIRQCEAFINNLHLPSKSVKEGLVSLRRNAEDDYSTLLHLERVLNMRDGGDFVPTLDTPIIRHTMRNRAFTNPLPGFAKTNSSGDHIGLSGGGSHLHKNARISTEIKLARDFDDDHGEGTGFEMGSKGTNVHILSTELDENYDPLQTEELLHSAEKKPAENGEILGNRKSPSRLNHAKNSEDDENISTTKDHTEPCEEEDEEEDQFAQKGRTIGQGIGIRQPRSNLQQNMARSLPVTVPLPEGLPKRGEIFDIPSDEDDEESDSEGTPMNKKELVVRRKSAIPDKIAMIARSMYDRDGLCFGESPQK